MRSSHIPESLCYGEREIHLSGESAALLNDQEVRKAYLGLHMLLNTGFAADLYGDRRRSSILQ